ncbi:MAG: rRNA maturation RNase YbeY [candidate division Zixibacteria bacterium]|nr:rRNA maturation RNase YbeY [candidate division Zixibacteria bacterium]
MKPSRVFSNQRGRLPKKDAGRLADLILTGERKRLPINIIFTDDAYIEKLNTAYRHRQRPTDVLSFSADLDEGILGEVYISIDTARRQAVEYGATVREEILRLVGHGALHLCGYDHHRKPDTARMKAREEKYLGMFLKP